MSSVSPSVGLRDILVAEGVIVSPWGNRIGGTGDSSRVAALIDTGGRGGEVKVPIDYPTVQIIVQGSSSVGGYTEAYNKAREIHDTLHGIDPQGTWAELVSCVAMNQPVWMGKSDKDQPMFSINFRLITKPVAVGNRPL